MMHANAVRLKRILTAQLELVSDTHERVAPALAALDLTLPLAHALWALVPGEPAPAMATLASRLRCSASSLTFVIGRLAERNLVQRMVAVENRRMTKVGLTAHGIAIREKMLDAMTSCSAVALLSKTEQDTLLSLLERALAAAD